MQECTLATLATIDTRDSSFKGIARPDIERALSAITCKAPEALQL